MCHGGGARRANLSAALPPRGCHDARTRKCPTLWVLLAVLPACRAEAGKVDAEEQLKRAQKEKNVDLSRLKADTNKEADRKSVV